MDESAPVGPSEELPDVSLLEALESEVRDLEEALARLDDGTYGTCVSCGTAVGEDVLAEHPAARWCEAHLPLHPA